MPSKQVRIKNNWHLDYKETIHGKEYAIPAGKTIELPRYEGVGLMGSCIGYVKWEGDPKDYPYAKALVMEDIPESGEMNIKDFIHPKTGDKYPTQEALDASLRRDNDKSLVQELIEGLAKQTTTGSKVYACPRCDFETPNKAAYLKHSEGKHEHSGGN